LPDRALLAALLALTVSLGGCGDLPQPFAGNPGATAMRLAAPPPSRLAVPVPTDALLTEDAADAWAGDIADALVAQEVPAVAHPAAKYDWRLVLSASLHGQDVVPTYTVQNARGETQGSTQGPPVPGDRWASADPAVLQQAAIAVAPSLASLLTSIEAARQQSDPNSLLNRPARVFILGVKGAPGDGDISLAREIALKLPSQGVVVQDQPAGADFGVAGEVRTARGAGGTERVEIQWIVTTAQGNEAGRIAQLNEVPPGTLDKYWGDVAVVVAEQAAGGIHQVITNQSARAPAAAKAAPPGGAAAAPAAMPASAPANAPSVPAAAPVRPPRPLP
jgi:hypothetical protein